jgi:hypothetical protein
MSFKILFYLARIFQKYDIHVIKIFLKRFYHAHVLKLVFTPSQDNIVGPCPKILKLGLNYSKEILELFGQIANKNGYKYCFSDDEELIKHIKELWMVTH